jgi:hypothetical protein
VKENEHLRLGLEFEPGADPVRGRLVTDAGEVLAFEGWLQMAALLESVLPSGPTQSTLEASP